MSIGYSERSTLIPATAPAYKESAWTKLSCGVHQELLTTNARTNGESMLEDMFAKEESHILSDPKKQSNMLRGDIAVSCVS